MINPSKKGEALNSPVARANEINDPQFENSQGYFNYDLTHQEFVTPRFGEITPTMHLDTVPADRVVVSDNSKLIRNQINGNFLSNLNQYVDSFYVSLRSVFPNNYEKLMPNPTKGSDLPNSALPQVPFAAYIWNLVASENEYVYKQSDDSAEDVVVFLNDLFDQAAIGQLDITLPEHLNTIVPRLMLVATILSRGQLLDYLGVQFDDGNLTTRMSSEFQDSIDVFLRAAYQYVGAQGDDYIYSVKPSLVKDEIDVSPSKLRHHSFNYLEDWRNAISDIFEAGRIPIFPTAESDSTFERAIEEFAFKLRTIFADFKETDTAYDYIYRVDEDAQLFKSGGYLNIGKALAYQQIVAQYYSNDHIDNIYSSELFMQLLRGVMYPTDPDALSALPTTTEPVFDWNGVNVEYDYISAGSFYTSLISDQFAGSHNRSWVFATLMFLLRRSLRYGDYFSTARPNMLAVSDQLGINVSDGMVSPIDVTKNLLLQRYLNAANYIGQGFLQYMASMYGVKPSDTGCIPRFISHRKVPIQNQITNNTANNQGAQTTNLVAFSDGQAYDVFIDDFGYILNLTSYDVLPVYKSGIENTYHLADRFDYFNPMMQNIGDQHIRLSELIGKPEYYDMTFGYTMRNAEYKFKLSKAHGAFCNSLPGYMVSYPAALYIDNTDAAQINPDFIRDKPVYLDSVLSQQTGVSPAEYFHFICSCTNVVKCARKIQATPSVLF